MSNFIPSLTLVSSAKALRKAEQLRVSNQNQFNAMIASRYDIEKHNDITADDRNQFDSFFLSKDRSLDDAIAIFKQVENKHARIVEKEVAKSPFNDFIEKHRGIGLKTFGRVWALIGDPTWNPHTDEPRLISHLWAYSGIGDPAIKKERGKKYKVNTNLGPALHNLIMPASQRLPAGSLDSYRPLYEAQKARYQGRVHNRPCAQCGTKSAEQQALQDEVAAAGITLLNDVSAGVGDPWKDGHINGAAIRYCKKQFLKDIYLYAQENA